MENTNLEILQPSRRRPKPGDIFVLRPKGHSYFYGRVIKYAPKMLLGISGPLIYIYRVASPTIEPIPTLRPTELLVPPIGTNFLPWSRGYFRFVEHRELMADDVLPVHCFLDDVNHQYRDEEGRILPGKVEPCGFFGLDSYRTIDDAVSTLLGIPLASD